MVPTPFPGMDPYLERPDLWPHVHNRLIVAIADDLAPRLRPRYYVAIEERVSLAAPDDLLFATRPDVAVSRPPRSLREPALGYELGAPLVHTVLVPLLDEIRETYLEIRAVPTQEVVTVLEILSPTNKRPGEGRRQYLQKRLNLLSTRTHLVEIDLLRAGEPMPMSGAPLGYDYHILVSRADDRPYAQLVGFTVRQPIPTFHLPLLPGDEEQPVDLNRLLHEVYIRAGFDLRIDYTQPCDPPLDTDDLVWSASLHQ